MELREIGETLELRLQFEKMNGVIPAIAQDSKTGVVLMLGYMNQEAFEKTLETGLATYYSRRSGKLWTKGETSGNFQRVTEIRVDCDLDAVLMLVEQKGSSCEFGYGSCFYRTVNGNSIELNQKPIQNPEELYGGIK